MLVKALQLKFTPTFTGYEPDGGAEYPPVEDWTDTVYVCCGGGGIGGSGGSGLAAAAVVHIATRIALKRGMYVFSRVA